MSKFIIDADAVTGQHSTFQYDPGTDQYLLNNVQDFTAIGEQNKREFNGDHRRHGDGIGRKVASIPLDIYMELRKKGIAQDRKAFARWLNDSDNLVFRTAPGCV